MKINQPMLFVGLGGTGGLVGSELERRLRAQLCGPDGTALNSVGITQRYQLPECLQFVYADYSEAELARLPHLSVEPSLQAAYGRTARATHDLLPGYDSSPSVTRELRAALPRETHHWLPPRGAEPKITPLRNGAGALPTVGRAALYGTLLRDDLTPVMGPLQQAIDIIGRSGGELSRLGGGPITGCDVFVAFSVAGGTGTGIFLDYLHFIGQAFKEKNFSGVRIYPLVVMPSAFPLAKGGGRDAELNAARAVVDLFRLVDEQNVPTADDVIGDIDHASTTTIHYPHDRIIRLDAGVMPTAFLFSRTAGIRPDDLRRSMVSLIMSLIGAELGDAPHRDDEHQTFASSFINSDAKRRIRAKSGIGHRGVSTALVASMTVPLEPLADLVSARLLAQGVGRLADSSAQPSHEYAGTVRRMFADAGLEELWNRESLPLPEPRTVPRGGPAIEKELRTRATDMQAHLEDLRRRVARRAPVLAEQFSPQTALERALRTMDPFQVERIVRGVPGDADPVTRNGVLGMLENRSREPAGDRAVQPPGVPRIKDGLAGPLSRRQWGDPEVVRVREAQDQWYAMRAKVIWHEAWRREEQRWRPKASALVAEITQLVETFHKHKEEEPRSYKEQLLELYDDRTGVSYLLPPQNSLTDFYDDVRERLTKRENLRDTDDEAALVHSMVGSDQWQAARLIGRRNADAAIAPVKAAIEQRIKELFAESGVRHDERPLLPSMAMLLEAAAGVGSAADEVGKTALDQFRFKIAGLIPHGFVPEGGGPLKVLVVYPRSQAKDTVEDYLRKHLSLPRGTLEFNGVETDSITVVLFRREMSLTEVPEVRKVLLRWAKAKAGEDASDYLDWRQRLGYGGEWLASTPEDRREILHRLLCALWKGQVEVVEGDDDNPRKVLVRLYGGEGDNLPGIELRLGEQSRHGISGWARLLHAYEQVALLDEGEIVETYCKALMEGSYAGLTTSGMPPHPLYVHLVESLAPRQVQIIRERLARSSGPSTEWAASPLEFWTELLPAALDTPFADKNALAPTLRSLREVLLDLDEEDGEQRRGAAGGPGTRDGQPPRAPDMTPPAQHTFEQGPPSDRARNGTPRPRTDPAHTPDGPGPSWSGTEHSEQLGAQNAAAFPWDLRDHGSGARPHTRGPDGEPRDPGADLPLPPFTQPYGTDGAGPDGWPGDEPDAPWHSPSPGPLGDYSADGPRRASGESGDPWKDVE